MMRLLKSGRWQADFYRRGERRERKHFPSSDQARQWLTLRQIESEHKHPTRTPTSRDLLDINEALDMLPPGVRLIEAARFYRNHHRPEQEVPIRDAYARFMADRETARLRPRSLNRLKYDIGNKLVAQYGSRRVSEIVTADLLALMPRTLAAATRNSLKASWANFFNYCGRKADNPAVALVHAQADERAPEIFKPAEAHTWLRHVATARPDLLPFFAVGLFAGLRTSEIEGLNWSDIEPGHIRVRPEVAKKRRQRLVVILPCLKSILEAHRRLHPPKHPDASITPIRTRARLSWIKKHLAAGGLAHWPHNVMRHSFISYRLAAVQSAEQVALEAGNSPDMIFQHYRALVTPAAARSFFAFRTPKQ